MGVVISFFNHKGGVGKTTTVHNIGYGLARLGKKVLLVDADPQMNLTAAVYGLSIDSIYSDKEASKWKERNEKYTSLDNIIKSIITERKIPATVNLYQYTNNNEKNVNGKDVIFDLLRGSISLTSLDASIMQIVQSNNPLTRDSILNLETGLQEIYTKYDFVLIDQSPSAASVLNAIFSLNASYVIIPSTPTFFCLQAVNNLNDIWVHWNELLQNCKSTYNTKGLTLQSKFIGLIIQLGKRYKSGNARRTEEWKEIVNSGINDFIESTHSKSVNKTDFVKIFNKSNPYIISTYDHFTDKLRSITERKGIPFVALTKEDLPAENSKKDSDKQYLKSWQSIQATNEYICKSLINLLNS